jgi:hypothetical protein
MWRSVQTAILSSRANRNFWIRQEGLSGLRKNMEKRQIRRADSNPPALTLFLQTTPFGISLWSEMPAGLRPLFAIPGGLLLEIAIQH